MEAASARLGLNYICFAGLNYICFAGLVSGEFAKSNPLFEPVVLILTLCF